MRLLPGDGELPLTGVVSALPAGPPFSVETPNLALLESIGAVEFARRARQAVSRLLAATGHADGASTAP